jgi:hypothetical protein
MARVLGRPLVTEEVENRIIEQFGNVFDLTPEKFSSGVE